MDQTTIDKIKDTFNFLIKDFGFYLINDDINKNHKAEHFMIYRNIKSKLQLEICAREHWFHCEIRRLINNQPAKYSDKGNCIGFESLAILESNNNYNHFDYFAGGSTKLDGVLKNTADLLKRHKEFLTTDMWLDIKKIRELEDKVFEKKFGSKPDRKKPTYFNKLKMEASNYLEHIGFKLIADSDERSPFEVTDSFNYFIFKRNTEVIKFSQVDWRDPYYIYYIEINGKRVFEIDLSKNQDINESVSMTMENLKSYIRI